jgi:hypothetical protein
MKYLNPINEYNNVLYHKIDYNEFIDYKEKFIKIDKKTIEIINNKLNQYETIDSYVSYSNDVISFNSSLKVIDIWKLEDEYYIVKIWVKGKLLNINNIYSHYLCDDLEGVLQFIDSTFN